MNYFMYELNKGIISAKEKGLDGFELLLYNYIKEQPEGRTTLQVKSFLYSCRFASDIVFKGLSSLIVRELIIKEGDLWRVWTHD